MAHLFISLGRVLHRRLLRRLDGLVLLDPRGRPKPIAYAPHHHSTWSCSIIVSLPIFLSEGHTPPTFYKTSLHHLYAFSATLHHLTSFPQSVSPFPWPSPHPSHLGSIFFDMFMIFAGLQQQRNGYYLRPPLKKPRLLRRMIFSEVNL